MVDSRLVETALGLVFDVSTAGRQGQPLVLMLHGFSVSRFFWSAQIETLGAAGYFAVAHNQRGYSAGARPDPTDLASYRIDLLTADALAIADRLGTPGQRFHLAGHDWGGSLAWHIADQHPERLASLTMLSRPHPQAFNRALKMPDGEQARRSKHHTTFLAPNALPAILAEDARWLRDRWKANGIPESAMKAHLSVIGNTPALEAALAWYRARGPSHKSIGPIKVPTLYIWGDADDTVGRPAAEWTREYIDAPYRFEILPGVGHYAADQVPEQVSRLMLEHVRNHPI